VPWKPKTYCIHTGCGELVISGRCTEHARQHNKQQQDRRDAKETWRDYDTQAWRYARKQVLSREPNCRTCGREATHVDHIVRLKDGGTHDVANLQPLCGSCHGLKTYNETIKAARDRQQKGKGKG